MRYQEWWFTQFPKQLSEHFHNVIVIGKEIALTKSVSSGGDFSNIERAITFECEQISEFLDYNINGDDYLLHADLSFPGIFHGALQHKPVKNAFVICHATSRNAYDYFAPMRFSKWPSECAHASLYKKVFVASEYHKNKLGWSNVVNLGALPNPPFKGQNHKKEYFIVSVARDSIQKRTKSIEKQVEKKYGKIITAPPFLYWSEYFDFLSSSKILLITSKEDTYNYSVVEAVLNSSIPLAPNRCSFPELLPEEYLYNDINELFERIELLRWTNGKGVRGLKTPKLLNQEKIDNFYQNLVSEMKNAI
jgi:hypothetical protein